MASGNARSCTGPARAERLNSCSGEVWPRGRLLAALRRGPRQGVSILVLVKYGLGARQTSTSSSPPRGLNSCSGEVWPRGEVRFQVVEHALDVSILVLVKYGLGAARWSRSGPARSLSQFLFW